MSLAPHSKHSKKYNSTLKISSFINGRFVSPLGQHRIAMVLPKHNTLQKVVLYAADTNEVSFAMEAANKAVVGWSSIQSALSYLNKCAEITEQNRIELATLLCHSTALPLTLAHQEVTESIAYLRYVTQHQLFSTETKSIRLPGNNVCAFYCDNSTTLLGLVQKIAHALSCANTVVINSSSKLVLVLFEITRLWNQILPRGVINTLYTDEPYVLGFFTKHTLVTQLVYLGHNREKSVELEIEAKRNHKRFNSSDTLKPSYILFELEYPTRTYQELFNLCYLYPQPWLGNIRIFIHNDLMPLLLVFWEEQFNQLQHSKSATTHLPLIYPSNSTTIKKQQSQATESGALKIVGGDAALGMNAECFSPSVFVSPKLHHLCNTNQWHGVVVTPISSLDDISEVSKKYACTALFGTASALNAALEFCSFDYAHNALGFNALTSPKHYYSQQIQEDSTAFSRKITLVT